MMKTKLKDDFSSLIQNRLHYVDNLKKLPSGWINDSGIPPSDEVIDVTKKILNYFNQKSDEINIIPTLIMGPIPQGGICIEFHAENDCAIYISLYNNQSVELDVKYYGYYHSLNDKDFHALEAKVFKQYEDISK